jgi:hypothetical protein
MDRTIAALVGGLAYSLTWAIGGGLFGAAVRLLARRRWRGAAVAPGGSVARVAFSGGRFGAVLGFLCGGLIVYLMDAPADILRDLIASSALVGVIALVAIVFGFVAYGLEWLGSSNPWEGTSGPNDESADRV